MMLRIAAFLVAVTFAGVSIADTAVRANRTLRVGTILSSNDLSRPMRGMIGMEVRRAIYAGHPVGLSDLGPPTLVRRNDIVRMRFNNGVIELRAEGRALSAGGMGETVEIMNLASRRTVRATIIGRRQVEVRR